MKLWQQECTITVSVSPLWVMILEPHISSLHYIFKVLSTVQLLNLALLVLL